MKRLIILLLVLSLVLAISCSKKPAETAEPETVSQPETVESTKETVEPETVEATVEAPKKRTDRSEPLFGERRPIAIMINNHPQAQPQAGWSHAKIAYEILVEGSLTRILMLSDAEEGVIGPIRSARPAFFEIAAEYRSIYSHVGNFEYVAESPMLYYLVDWDEFSHGGYYRTSHRYAPHNLYGSMEGVYDSAKASGVDLTDKDVLKVLKDHFQVYEEAKEYDGGSPAKSISFTYDGAQQLKYTYDEDSGMYRKQINGVEVIDEDTGDALEIANFIILERPHGKMPNGIHEYVDYLTPGTARLFVQGQEFELEYSKEASEEPMKFTLDGKDLILNPGFTYINVVPTGLGIVVE